MVIVQGVHNQHVAIGELKIENVEIFTNSLPIRRLGNYNSAVLNLKPWNENEHSKHKFTFARLMNFLNLVKPKKVLN